MQIEHGYNINLDRDLAVQVEIVPIRGKFGQMPTYQIISRLTRLTLRDGLSLVEVRREMEKNGWRMVVPD